MRGKKCGNKLEEGAIFKRRVKLSIPNDEHIIYNDPIRERRCDEAMIAFIIKFIDFTSIEFFSSNDTGS